ncbi:NADH dehydrogenase [ubiquinone] 1 alpha subcomplex assembly factor 8 [Pantherophis guttatus]|uniref:NADH dehydrogenase [ubiquinone] 1 alpha subcomplex assembly factor 8 n=1 Tax=Pantherophis guttatus TaxID=94885 RepID=A0A6P9BCR4_PANGU|nr:NADH dehydrogenase [ubiquinone] 1 alpha subcomplex assembly factor 8 [Thamnophis elegans]XP_034268663.1 NADH dehydrogenase [ubiquinone] 1 alpha subcomplex assembly factor 8 [Pantherophis guttatus]
MSSRAVWERVRARVQRFPELLASCGEQASVYGKCIASNTTEHGNLKKDVCAKEFAMLMDCFTEAAKKNVKT